MAARKSRKSRRRYGERARTTSPRYSPRIRKCKALSWTPTARRPISTKAIIAGLLSRKKANSRSIKPGNNSCAAPRRPIIPCSRLLKRIKKPSNMPTIFVYKGNAVCIALMFFLLVSLASCAGQGDTILVHSSSMKKDIKCTVILPADYQRSKERLPVVYLLHGFAGSNAQWPDLAPQLKGKADELHILIVCPDAGYDSW